MVTWLNIGARSDARLPRPGRSAHTFRRSSGSAAALPRTARERGDGCGCSRPSTLAVGFGAAAGLRDDLAMRDCWWWSSYRARLGRPGRIEMRAVVPDIRE